MKRIFLLASILTLVACNGGKNQTNIEIVTNMMDGDAIKSQDWDPAMGDQVQMRMPPDGTVSRGHPPYKYLTDYPGGEKQPNPLAGNMSPETLTLGQKYFEIYCKVCHGPEGRGDGPVAVKMAVKPRNLMSAEALAYSDGRIYQAITAGKGVMGSYMSQITEAKTRWAVVNYVRTLQKNAKK